MCWFVTWAGLIRGLDEFQLSVEALGDEVRLIVQEVYHLKDTE